MMMLIQKFGELDGYGVGLGENERTQLVEVLNRNIANAALLATKYKKYHWTVSGALFRELHLLFDDHATNVNETIDEQAERVMTLGGVPIGSPEEHLKFGTLKSAEPGILTPATMLEDLLQDHHKVILELRADIETATGCGDPGTADLFTRIVQVHEKDAWFIAEHRKRDR
ncbi:MAG TPA: DNA starvation/stationary phase protection protein [Acidobacteriota bacterium]|nr:DNA starvation/stationary phase protection protein [Acidobacteriota bacterium]HNB73046.1 DNA starvation/stationary phase protection protein [Acidobacteriota bacterium]HNC43572.1 DNA starvation/stationary phase protection protein [Acidobacteriota bacterium]